MAKWFTSKLSRPGSDCVILEGDAFSNKLVATAASAEIAKLICDQHNASEVQIQQTAALLAIDKLAESVIRDDLDTPDLRIRKIVDLAFVARTAARAA